MYRVLYLGQKPLGEKCLKLLLERGKDIIQVRAIVSNENIDNWWKSNACYQEALKRNITFISNSRRNNEAIKQAILLENINLIISVQHNWILPEEHLNLVKGFAFNLHNSKLPDYKGYNAINHAILNGENYYTSTIHWMVPEVDMGAIAFEETIKIKENETALSLYNRTQHTAVKLFEKFIDAILMEKNIPYHKITEVGTFYSRNSLEGLRQIKDLSNELEIDRKSRAFYFPPFEPAYILVKGKKYYVLPKDAINIIKMHYVS